jgi:hypothetical protein
MRRNGHNPGAGRGDAGGAPTQRARVMLRIVNEGSLGRARGGGRKSCG